jgi:hypothetical protein
MFVIVAGSVNVSDQFVTSLVPRFVIVNCPVKPLPQSLDFWKTVATCAWAAAVRASRRMGSKRTFIVTRFWGRIPMRRCQLGEDAVKLVEPGAHGPLGH